MANRIKELREKQGYSQADLANLVGTTSQQISHLEMGKRNLTQGWMERIAQHLAVRPADLMDGGAGEVTEAPISDDTLVQVANSLDILIQRHNLKITRPEYLQWVLSMNAWVRNERAEGREPSKEDIAFEAAQRMDIKRA